MRYVIIGAGAVGGTIGVRLAQAGQQVTLVARGAHLDVIRARGLTLRQPDGEVTSRLAAVPGPGDQPLPADTVLILTVKSQDTDGALAAWVDAPVAGGGTAGERLPLFTAQNGVANERAALRLFAAVHPVCVWLPATHLEPGVVVANGYPHPGMLHIGRYPTGADDTDRAVAADLTAAGFVAPVRADVLRWKYGKLLSNLGNGLQALLGRDIPEELAERVRAEEFPRWTRRGSRTPRPRRREPNAVTWFSSARSTARPAPAAPPGRAWPEARGRPRSTTSTGRSRCSVGCTAYRRRPTWPCSRRYAERSGNGSRPAGSRWPSWRR
ncbi:hypothetical protein GCM10027614_38570 [Micromonospora vulcania]